MGAYWCERAWLGGDAVADGVVVTVDGGRIAAVEPGVAMPPAGATRLDGLTLPGFANAHSHAFHRALRGRTQAARGTFWTWRDQMYELAAALDPDSYEQLATATFAEMVLAGYTCVGEFHYLHHGPGGIAYSDPNEIGLRLVAAAAGAGIRLTLLDTCYLTGGIDADLGPVQRRFADRSAEAWGERVDQLAAAETPRCLVGAAVHSVRAVPPAAVAEVAAWASDRGAVLHAHVSEQPQENADCLAAHGCTPTELFDRAGALRATFTAVHATHLSGDDIDRFASARATCCVCPTTERDLADGIGPTTALRDAGVEVCIGSDSHAVIDPFEETRAVELDERLSSLRRGTHRPSELLGGTTAGGYASLGWEGGRIAPGVHADLVTVGFRSPRLAGTDRDRHALAAVVFAAGAADVTDVVVGGDHIVRAGVHRDIDVPAALDAAIRSVWAAAER